MAKVRHITGKHIHQSSVAHHARCRCKNILSAKIVNHSSGNESEEGLGGKGPGRDSQLSQVWVWAGTRGWQGNEVAEFYSKPKTCRCKVLFLYSYWQST